MPEEKELGFFDSYHDKGLDWYSTHFDDAARDQILGEITPTYLHEARLDVIVKTLPWVKLIVVLRHPVDRAYSAYRLFWENYRGKNFEEAFADGPYLRDLSMYAGKMREVFAQFPGENVHCLLYDDIRQRPVQVLAEIFQFLGVDRDFVPDAAETTFNAVIFPRTQNLLEKTGLGFLVEKFRDTTAGTQLKTLVRRLSAGSPKSKDYDPELLAIFREDVLATQELIGRDLSGWLS